MNPAVGHSPELSLRVSAATLSRVIFPHPTEDTLLLALEHKATVHQTKDNPIVTVKSQPFGGAARILNPVRLQEIIGDFNYDSERSRSEADFRIFMHPSKWPALVAFCKHESEQGGEAFIDHDPLRELVEEFDDTLGIVLSTQDYLIEHVGLVIENDPRPTSNVRAPEYPTARVYWVDEVQIVNPDLCLLILGAGLSTDQLCEKAIEDFKEGGRGRANAIFTAPLDKVRAAYLKLTPEERNEPLEFERVTLSSNVPAILEDMETPKFEWIG
jgi:hypothetical protein